MLVAYIPLKAPANRMALQHVLNISKDDATLTEPIPYSGSYSGKGLGGETFSRDGSLRAIVGAWEYMEGVIL